MLKRALGFEYEEVITEIVDQDGEEKKLVRKVKKTVPPDVTAQIYWLKNRRRDKWRWKPDEETDKTKAEVELTKAKTRILAGDENKEASPVDLITEEIFKYQEAMKE